MITKENSEQLSPFLQKLTSLTKEELEGKVKDYFESYLKKELKNVEFKNGIQKIVDSYKSKYFNKKKVDEKFHSFVYYKNNISPYQFIPALLFVDNEITTTCSTSISLENKFFKLGVSSSQYLTFEINFLELFVKYLAEIISVDEVVKFIANIITDLIKKQVVLVGKGFTLYELKERSADGLISIHSLTDSQLKQFYFELLENECFDFSPSSFKELFLFKQIAKEIESRKQNKKED